MRPPLALALLAALALAGMSPTPGRAATLGRAALDDSLDALAGPPSSRFT